MKRYEIYKSKDKYKVRTGNGRRAFSSEQEIMSLIGTEELSKICKQLVFGEGCRAVPKIERATHLLAKILNSPVTSTGEVLIRDAEKPKRIRKNREYVLKVVPDRLILKCHRFGKMAAIGRQINTLINKGFVSIGMPDLVRLALNDDSISNTECWAIGTNAMKKFKEYLIG